jgi:uncharacterized coiled-coil protein SlyX
MEIGNNKIETIDGKMLWTPKGMEYTKYNITTIPADVDISANLDELLGKPTLIEELTKLVIKDEQERYIRELLIRNKKLEERIEYLERSNNRREDTILELRNDVGEANESVTWWSNRFNAVNRDKTLYKHRLDTANEYIESRKENMIPDHYNDLKYILNECDLESSW